MQGEIDHKFGPLYMPIQGILVEIQTPTQRNLIIRTKPLQCVITQQYSSIAFVSLQFQSRMENFDATFKNFIISIFQTS